MRSFIDIQRTLLPDLLQVMQKRYTILRHIGFMQPVGRRSLAASLGYTERILRSEVDFLKDQNLIIANSIGMSLTAEGKNLLEELEDVMRELKGINEMELELKHRLGIHRVIIVPGDSDESSLVKNELGKACASCMKKLLGGENIIAVTGGSTMAAVAEQLTPEEIGGKNLLFVPARGGIGEDVQNQANTVCSIMARNTKSKHRVFYVPDQVSTDIYESLIKEPIIHEVLHLIQSSSLVLHGIGDAITMAERRKTSPEDLEKLKKGNASGEAFGCYFNEAGEVVHKSLIIGLQLGDLGKIPNIIAVAGGGSKAKAIRAYMKQAPSSTILITDEGAAKKLIKG